MADATENQTSQISRIIDSLESLVANVRTRQDGFNALCVDSVASVVLTKKYRVINQTNARTFTGTSYNLLYEVVGTGVLHGFHYDTNTDRAIFRLVIDDEIIFDEIQIKNISDLSLKAAGATPVLLQNRSGLTVESGSDLDFSPHSDIPFFEHVRLYIKKSGGDGVTVNRNIIYITKTTEVI